VLNDIRTIISDDSSLQTGVLPALEKYNTTQFITVDVPGHDHQVIISEAGRVKGSDRFIDPRSKQTFAFDHLRLEALDCQPHEPDEASEPFREGLEVAALAYIADHFHDGVTSVFTAQSSPTTFTIQLVANKYNPPNFWSGRWRSEYVVDMQERTITGSVLVNVHYYEQGNVQLSTSFTPNIALPESLTTAPASASKILALISKEESEHQTSLNDAFQDMSEKAFKTLRRALPLTRQKLDWDKVTGYKLGAELTASKGIFQSVPES